MSQGCEKARARRKVVSFLVIVVVFSVVKVALQLYVPLGSRLLFVTWSPFVADALGMWSVGIAGLIVLLGIDHSVRDLGLRSCRPRYFIVAAAVPIIYCILIYVPAWLFGLGEFRGGWYFLTRLFLLLPHLPLSLLFAAGEELGWRGVLVPNLARAFGFTTAALVPGPVWAIWHWPDILLFGYRTEAGAVYSMLFFSLSLVGLGVFLTWLRLASGSLWPPVVFHGVHNVLIWSVFEAATDNGRFTVYFTTEFGVGLSIGAAIIGYLCWTSRAAGEWPTHISGPLKSVLVPPGRESV